MKWFLSLAVISWMAVLATPSLAVPMHAQGKGKAVGFHHNPVHGSHEQGPPPSDIGLELGADGNTLTMQVTPQRGKIARIRVRTTSPDGVLRDPLDAGSTPSDGIDLRRVRIDSNGWVSFYFRTNYSGRFVKDRIPTDPFYVTYDVLEDGDLATLCCWARPGHGGGPLTVVVTPEPGTSLLVGLGVSVVGWARRRRVTRPS